MATEELLGYLLTPMYAQTRGEGGNTAMEDELPVIIWQLSAVLWCGHRESKEDMRLSLWFLLPKLRVIYCTREYREDIYNGEWNESGHQLQLRSRAVPLGSLKKESSFTLLDYMTWLLAPWKTLLKLCFLFPLLLLAQNTQMPPSQRDSGRWETFPFFFSQSS